MVALNELSNDPKFTIKYVGSQTGILPVTIRAWERRYQITRPQRSDNRYRMYSERDIAVLNWVKSRVEEGISISSAVLELRQMEKKGIFPQVVAQAEKLEPVPAMKPSEYEKQLYQALIRHDESEAGLLLDDILSVFELEKAFSLIITPCLVKIGDAWYHGEIRVSTEHFASTFIRGKLLAAFQDIPIRKNAPYILAGCAPSEQHEIGSLMFAILLRQAGYQVEYLGPDIPLSDLIEYADEQQPNMVILSATTESSGAELLGVGKKLGRMRVPPIFAYGGRAYSAYPALRQKMDGVFLGGEFATALNQVHDLLKTVRVAPVRRPVMYV